MKKVLLALILAGGTIFAANAKNIQIALPGFYLNIGNGGPRNVRVVPPVRVHRPTPVRYHKPVLPPKRHHDKHVQRGKHHRR